LNFLDLKRANINQIRVLKDGAVLEIDHIRPQINLLKSVRNPTDQMVDDNSY